MVRAIWGGGGVVGGVRGGMSRESGEVEAVF